MAQLTEIQTLELDEVLYVFRCSWSDGSVNDVKKSYEELFALQCKLLDEFPVEAGEQGSRRILPVLPGKQLLGSLFTLSKAAKHAAACEREQSRLPHIALYVSSLLKLPIHISQCELVLNFFRGRQNALPFTTQASDVCVHQGFLYKRGQIFKTWKRRFFILTNDGYLRYYDDIVDARVPPPAMGTFHLGNALSVVSFAECGEAALGFQWPPTAQPAACFILASPERTLYLFADDVADATSWLDDLRRSFRRLHGQPEPQATAPSETDEVVQGLLQPQIYYV